MIFKINRDLLIIKSLYFFELSVVACLFIYLNPFMVERGVSGSELAVISFVAHIVAFFTRPLFGYLADKYQRYREILAVSAAICFVVNLVQLFIPKYQTSKPYFLLTNFEENNHFTICFYNSSKILCQPCLNSSRPQVLDISTYQYPINMSCSRFPIFQSNSTNYFNASNLCRDFSSNCFNHLKSWDKSETNSGLTWSLTFWLFLICKIIAHTFYSANISLTDAVTFVTLGKDKCHKFGVTRMFGTLGILVFSITTAFMLQFFQSSNYSWIVYLKSVTHYTPCFIFGLAMFVFVMLFSLLLGNDKPLHSEPFWMSLGLLFRNLEVSIFFIFSIFGGFIFSTLIEYYFIVIFQMFPQMPKYFPGLLFAVMTIAEAIFNGASSIILKYVNNEFWIAFAFFTWALRWLSYYLITNYWFFLIIEFLNGPAFGLLLPCMMSHISKFANRTTQGRVQCVFAGLFFNIGGAFGALYGGIILDQFGYRALFISMIGFSTFCSVIYYPLQKLLVPYYANKRSNRESGNDQLNVENSTPLLKVDNNGTIPC